MALHTSAYNTVPVRSRQRLLQSSCLEGNSEERDKDSSVVSFGAIAVCCLRCKCKAISCKTRGAIFLACATGLLGRAHRCKRSKRNLKKFKQRTCGAGAEGQNSIRAVVLPRNTSTQNQPSASSSLSTDVRSVTPSFSFVWGCSVGCVIHGDKVARAREFPKNVDSYEDDDADEHHPLTVLLG